MCFNMHIKDAVNYIKILVTVYQSYIGNNILNISLYRVTAT